MECIICGKWFSSTDKTKKLCMTCERVLQHPSIGIAPERLLELSQAEQDGRLVVLPCKVGDKIFHLFYGEIQNLLVSSVIYRGHGGYSTNFLVECIPFHRFYWREEIGKTVFLTREEAEAALKKREESTDD